MFSGDGSGLAFDGATQFDSFPAETFDPVATNHVSLEVVTGGWDGSRSGESTIALTVNGQLLRTFTLGHNYKGNFISLYYALPSVGHPNVCTFDNLTQTFSALGKAMGATTFTLGSPQVNTSGNISVSVGFLARSVVANPSFEDSYTPAWAPPGYLFMNRWTPNTETTGFNGTYGAQTILDFADNGVIPDRNLVAFIENNGSFEQNLAGLAVGAQHWLQFRYNVSANSSSGQPVGKHNRGNNEVVIENPSFEASDKPATSPFNFENDVKIAGWTVDPANGWGANASGDSLYDNGQNPDQDLVLFVQGAGKSVSLAVTTVGNEYVVLDALGAGAKFYKLLKQ